MVDPVESFLDALYAFNAQRNLTRVPRDQAMSRHIRDSLLHADLMPQGASVLDIGTGPGFPAWPLAQARPDLHITALDSNGKMLEFLRSQPLPNLKVVQARAEEWGHREEFDVVTGRAVAPLLIQLEISAPFARVGGVVLPMRGQSDADQLPSEIGGLGLRLESTEIRMLDDSTRVFPVYRKVSRSQSRYPRPWAEIKREPIQP